MENINFWNGAGTYYINFENDEEMYYDQTEFFAESKSDLMELWQDFCDENGFQKDSLIDIQFVCSECI